AGGTGGHVFPALAVANILRQDGWQVEWLGTQNGIEARIVPAENFTLHCISAVGLRGKSIGKLLMAPWQLLRAQWQSLSVLRRFRPDVVLGMGGFASGPGGLAARWLRIPLVVHEQNAVAGTTNRILSRHAKKILFAFPRVFPRGELVGNPVRADIATLAFSPKKIALPPVRLRLLVLGGSQGARALNTLLPQALALLPEHERPEVFHQAGRDLLQETVKNYAKAQVTARIEPFVEDMVEKYRWADFVVCRAGAMTVYELACAQLPALLIPLPTAIDDHQTMNARWFEEVNAARVLPQATLDAKTLAQEIQSLMNDRKALQAMSHAMKGLAQPDAASKVAKICEDIFVEGLSRG
ncbi:MAG TPA: undecaprenyldiphospho-muramoylpentapeptide beta-N-acetylglucosaminyltransferase, partial [Pseudomonadales bacterium]|nr:undecaprenyldiphospho-muramoylpentapeptide beta-N-acetylglucosaminyltransferase [Pseudomonadales bacterium]